MKPQIDPPNLLRELFCLIYQLCGNAQQINAIFVCFQRLLIQRKWNEFILQEDYIEIYRFHFRLNGNFYGFQVESQHKRFSTQSSWIAFPEDEKLSWFAFETQSTLSMSGFDMWIDVISTNSWTSLAMNSDKLSLYLCWCIAKASRLWIEFSLHRNGNNLLNFHVRTLTYRRGYLHSSLSTNLQWFMGVADNDITPKHDSSPHYLMKLKVLSSHSKHWTPNKTFLWIRYASVSKLVSSAELLIA